MCKILTRRITITLQVLLEVEEAQPIILKMVTVALLGLQLLNAVGY